ncbi:Ger(x)C family spore germination protein [Polycladomyces subterraneus]|uniref:Ger(X)C family spore germination protein n=1 Tax=Polycladomyces subterraneus TaxID=1016997 RepID=A0ABT8IK68_9BACL|nr:Ger(x)C family spore germination protein [Polycladomyces subterraneus]MDN4593149.1 Ger(x)C family spore germination protein [Polycladomyces subterraneus]
MSKRRNTLVFLIVLLMILPGCWDMEFIKDDRLIYSTAFDYLPDGKLMFTVTIRDSMETGGGAQQLNTVMKSVARTTRESRDLIQSMVKGKLSAYKIRIHVLGESVAKKNIYPFLDVLYRDPKSALNARICVAEGKAGEILQLNNVGPYFIGETMDEMIAGEEQMTVVPKENLSSIAPVMFDHGQDFTLPMIKKAEKNVQVTGAALFHGHHMTGKLNRQESTLMLLMAGRKEKLARLTIPVDQKQNPQQSNYITFEVHKVEPKMKVTVKSKNLIDVDFPMKLTVSAVEYPLGELSQKAVRQKLNKQLSTIFTASSQQVIQKLQQANCDVFGVGRQLIAFHHDVWKRLHWETDYRKVRFHPRVQVEIDESGIIN